jgi:chromosomal replication initiation ATPase DnaA
MLHRPYSDDKLAEVRPTSTFESFELYEPDQQKVVDLLTGVAQQVITKADQIMTEEFPFAAGKILFLHGEPGRGKTHLVEAFINRILKARPDLRKRMCLSRGRFMYDFLTDTHPYGPAAIVVIDDMFHDKSSVGNLCKVNDVNAFMKFMTMVYERRILVLITSNFPLVQGGILQEVAKVDKVGRVLSRSKEILAGSGEINLLGKDFREVLAERNRTDGFTL